MNSSSFGLYANPNGSGAYVDASRGLSNAVAIGQKLQFQWAINYDSGSGGNKGFNLYSGGAEVFNINNGGSQDITCNGVNVGFGYGTAVMTWSFERTGVNSVKVTANDRDGTGTFTTNLVVSNGAIDSIKFYAFNMQAGDPAQPYFNNFEIITGTNDYVAPVITLTKKAVAVVQGSNFDPDAATATDNKDGDVSSAITNDAATILTSTALNTPGTYTVTYSVKDAANNTGTATQIVVVKSAGTFASQYTSIAVPGAFTTPPWQANGSAGNGMIKVADFKWRLLYYFLGSSSEDYLITANGGYDIKWGAGGVRGAGNANLGGVVTAKGWYCFELDETTDTVRAVALDSTDADADGIPDQWEAYFGGQLNPPATNLVSSADVDSDGYPNVDEFNYGSSPVSAASIPENRTVKFTVDMKVPTFNETFGPGDKVIVIGNFSGWSDSANELTLNATSGLYELSVPFAGPSGRNITYKYKIIGTNKPNGGYEPGSDRTLTLGTSGAPQDLPTAYFGGWTESRKFILSVDMSVQQQKGKFDPTKENVVVRGWNGWESNNALPMSSSGSGKYSAAAYINDTVSVPSVRQYKFFVTGKTPEDSGYELVWDLGLQTNRAVSSAGTANLSTNTNISTAYFGNDDGIGPNIVLNGTDTIHITEGAGFDEPGVLSARDLAENTNFKNGVVISGSVNDSVPGSYTLTYKVSDNSGNESVKTRTVVVDPSAYRTWSGGSPLEASGLIKYAVGGASSLTASDGRTPVVGGDANTLTLSAIVRTNDPSVFVVGEATTDLSGVWDGSLVSEKGLAEGVDQANVPNGCERKVFSVERGSDPKKFIRIRATK